jgi:hypothetical protein
VAIVQTGTVNGSMAALIAADAALHRDKVTTAELKRAAGLLGGPRVIEVRHALDRADGRAESPGETRLREAVRLMGFSATPQVTIRDGSFVAVVDLVSTMPGWSSSSTGSSSTADRTRGPVLRRPWTSSSPRRSVRTTCGHCAMPWCVSSGRSSTTWWHFVDASWPQSTWRGPWPPEPPVCADLDVRAQTVHHVRADTKVCADAVVVPRAGAAVADPSAL